MKLPNGCGSIYKTKEKRRKPYRVYVTIGWDNGKQIKKQVGYAESYKEGLKLLEKYHGDPFNLDYKNLTFSDIWSDVKKELETQVENEKMSLSNLKSLSLAYKNHCQKLHNEKILDIKYKKLQQIIDESNLGRTAKGNIKTVCVKIFNYAINIYELPLKNNPAIRLYVGERSESTKHIPFTGTELKILWEHSNNDIIKTLLIFCYSGLRPNELFNIKSENIHLEKEYMIGGSKTKAGKNRIIPIHPYISNFIKEMANNNSKYPFQEIIENFNYGKYERKVKKIMYEFNLNHTPYDGRHTFSTLMKQSKADEYLLKRILGHSIQDLTERVYTHREIEELINEVKKIK